jgi:hypothetical protein
MIKKSIPEVKDYSNDCYRDDNFNEKEEEEEEEDNDNNLDSHLLTRH